MKLFYAPELTHEGTRQHYTEIVCSLPAATRDMTSTRVLVADLARLMTLAE